MLVYQRVPTPQFSKSLSGGVWTGLVGPIQGYSPREVLIGPLTCYSYKVSPRLGI